MAAVSADSVIKDLKGGKYAPVYFLQGDEPYYIDYISDFIEKNCLNEGEKSFNQTILYGKDINMNTILQNAKRFPMMSERQVVIVKEAQEISDFGKESTDKIFGAYLEKPLPSTVLVFCYKYKTLDARKTMTKNIDKFSVLVNSKKMYDDKLPNWVEGYFGDKKFKITSKGAIMMADFIGNNLSRLSNEADKLLINLKEGQEVNEDLIEKYVGISKEFNVFELQKALVKKDILKSNQIVNYFEANPKNNPIIPIISVLFGFFSKVLMVHGADDKSESALAKMLQVNPYFVKDYISAARIYPLSKVVNIIHNLKQADLMSKGIDNVSAGDGQILRELIFKILH
jgi:DNA polymerase III subunit delta